MALNKWNIDNSHSSLDFSIRHLMISKVKGTFQEYSAEIEADPTDLTTAKIAFTIQTASINTRNEDRDAHLRSADFFNVEEYPKMTFTATEILKTEKDTYNIVGDLTISGVTRKESFTATFEGSSTDPWGNEKIGFSVEGKINRSDYGLKWNAALETGGVLVGEEVKISLELQAAKA